MVRGAALIVSLVLAATAAGAGPSGQALYGDYCASCHMRTGLGVPGAYPSLRNSPLVAGDSRALSDVVLKGRNAMPAFDTTLNDADMAAVLTFIRASWGATRSAVSPRQVATARKAR